MYKQERVGKEEKIFEIYKFRTMVQDAEKQTGPVWAQENDHRVTSIGKILRRSRLDEIPQLLNILKGEMSLVGPRPERLYFVEKLNDEMPTYWERIKVKPGLTGMAQVEHSYDRSLDDVKIKLEHDLYYMENASLKLDLTILLKTVLVMLKGRGAQ